MRAALLAWEPTPSRTDVQRVTDDLIALAQTELSNEPGVAWVERTELDKLLAETDLAASGRLDPRASLRIGKLARAQLLITGRLDATDHTKTSLYLEAIDLDHGDLVASSVTPIPPRPHKHYALREEDRVAAVGGLRALLNQASTRQRELAAKPAVAFLFFANTGPSSRLDSAGGRLANKLRAATERTGGRLLRFPRARDAEGEQDLAVLGLAEADEQAWRSVADLYVWGEYKEIPSDGLSFEQTPVEASLTLWDGTSTPRIETWRGTVGTLDEGEKKLVSTLTAAIRPVSSGSSETRATAAKLLTEQATAMEKNHADSMEKPDFWTSEVGRNFQNGRVYLLQTAAFLEPANAEVRRALHRARWDRRAWAGGMPIDARWQFYSDLCIITDRFPDPQHGLAFSGAYERAQRVEALQMIMRDLSSYVPGASRRNLPQILRAAQRWVQEVNSLESWAKSHPDASHEYTHARRNQADFIIGIGNGPFLSTQTVGVGIIRNMLDGTWPVLAPVFKEWFDEHPKFARKTAARYLDVYEPYGEEAAALARLNAVLSSKADAHGENIQDLADNQKVVIPPDRAPTNPEWDKPAGSTFKYDLGPALDLQPKPLFWWHKSQASREMFPSRGERGGRRLLPPDAITLAGFDGRRLWINGALIPDTDEDKSSAYRLAILSPDTRNFDDIGSRLPTASRVVGVVTAKESVYVATAFDGLLQLGPTPGKVERITPDAGLPSLKLAAITAYDGGLVAAAAAPETGLARLDFSTGKWLNLILPDEPATKDVASLDSETNDHVQVAGLGPWILVGKSSVNLLDTRTGLWTEAFATCRAELSRKQRELQQLIQQDYASRDQKAVDRLTASIASLLDWRVAPPDSVIADDSAFWLGGKFGLVRFDPKLPMSEAKLVKCPPVLALADAGPWLWVAFRPEPANSRHPFFLGGEPPHALGPYPDPPEWRCSVIGLFDKSSQRWRGYIQVTGGITSLRASPGRLFAAGSTLLEMDTRTVAPLSQSARETVVHDPMASWAGLATLPLQQTVELGDKLLLRKLLTAGESVDGIGTEGWTALHLAAYIGDNEAVTLLLTAGANLNAFTRDGRDALGLAASNGHLQLVQQLLAAGADPRRQSRVHVANLPGFGVETGPAPASAPVEPNTSSVVPLPDGRVRVNWSIQPSNYDGFIIYRRDTPENSPFATPGLRWNRLGSNNQEKYIGHILDKVVASGRTWIDESPGAVGSTSTYTVVAVNSFDRYGPPEPVSAGSIVNSTPMSERKGVFETHHRALDPTALMLAAESGHTEVVAALLAAGADPVAVDSGGCTALHYAVRKDHLSVAKQLIAAGTPVDALAEPNANLAERFFEKYTGDPVTALWLVYNAHSNRALFELLLSSGANILASPPYGGLPSLAAASGRENDIELLLAAEPRPAVAYAAGQEAFMGALGAGRSNLAQRLGARYFDPTRDTWRPSAYARGSLVERALNITIRDKDIVMLNWLISHGADPRSFSFNNLLENNPLENALALGVPATFVRALVAAGADPGRLSPKLRAQVSNPDIRAALSGSAKTNPPVADINSGPILYTVGSGNMWSLLYGPQSEAQKTPEDSSSDAPLHRDRLIAAAASGDLEGIRTALAAKADPNSADAMGRTALVHALQGNHIDAARLLIDAGTSLNRLTEFGSSPLGFAVRAGDRKLIDEMIDLGADLNLVKNESPSPLTFALQTNLSLADHLLDRGANPEWITFIDGMAWRAPPLFHCARQGNLVGIKLLVNHGANPKACILRSINRDTPARPLSALFFAAASNDLPTLDYFLALGLDPKMENTFSYNALDWAIIRNADRTAAKLRSLGVKTSTERGIPPRE